MVWMHCFLCVVWCVTIFVFFFFKQKTAYEWRISDWSSYVCSSDLERMDREQQVASERDQRDIESDKGAEPHAGQNEEGRKTVTTMVDKIAIGWPFYPAISRQAAIHRIAKPLDYIANERHSKPSGRQAARSIADKNSQGAHHPERKSTHV